MFLVSLFAICLHNPSLLLIPPKKHLRREILLIIIVNIDILLSQISTVFTFSWFNTHRSLPYIEVGHIIVLFYVRCCSFFQFIFLFLAVHRHYLVFSTSNIQSDGLVRSSSCFLLFFFVFGFSIKIYFVPSIFHSYFFPSFSK